VAAAIVLAFLVGAAFGFVLGRRNPAAAPSAPAAAPAPRRTKPTSRAKKAGLTDASLTPQDDILERLRKVADGELDPSELSVEAPPPPTPEEIAANEERLAAEQRVLDRLRRQVPSSRSDDGADERPPGSRRAIGSRGAPPEQAQPSDLANDRDNDDSR
jgi:hypothetical protein